MSNEKICIKCQVELRPKKNGILMLEMATFGPMALWSSDLWYCPCCSMEAVIGFGEKPIIRSSDQDFDEQLTKYRKGSTIIPFWANDKEKQIFEKTFDSAIRTHF